MRKGKGAVDRGQWDDVGREAWGKTLRCEAGKAGS